MKKIFPVIILIIVIVGGAFYGGMVYGQSKNTNNINFPNFENLSAEQRQQRAGDFGRMANSQGGAFINGEVISKDDASLTVKLPDGGSKIVFFSASTQIMKSSTTTADVLQTGDNLMVTGQDNSDGSLSAQTIQISLGLPRNN